MHACVLRELWYLHTRQSQESQPLQVRPSIVSNFAVPLALVLHVNVGIDVHRVTADADLGAVSGDELCYYVPSFHWKPRGSTVTPSTTERVCIMRLRRCVVSRRTGVLFLEIFRNGASLSTRNRLHCRENRQLRGD